MQTESLWQELTYFPASFTTYALVLFWTPKPKLQYHSPDDTQPSLTIGESLRLFERMWIHSSTSWMEGQSLLQQRKGTVLCEHSKTSAFGVCVVLWFGLVLVGWLFSLFFVVCFLLFCFVFISKVVLNWKIIDYTDKETAYILKHPSRVITSFLPK